MYVKILAGFVGILLFIFVGLATNYYVSSNISKTVETSNDDAMVDKKASKENSSANEKRESTNHNNDEEIDKNNEKKDDKSPNKLGKNLYKEKMDGGVEIIYGVVSDVMIAPVCAQELDAVRGKYRTVHPQGKYVAVTVIVANNQNDAITVSEGSYQLVDDKGREYAASSKALSTWSLGKTDGNLGVLTQINPGNSERFIFFYDVPSDIDIKKLQMKARGGMIGDSVIIPLNNYPEFSILD